MSGDNLHDPQPDIRYSVNVHHHEEWEEMSLSERLKVLIPNIKKWEHEYLKMDPNLTNRQKEILRGYELKSNEGMLYGQMYNDWKHRKGYEV